MAFAAVWLQPAGAHAASFGAVFTFAGTVLGYVAGSALPGRVQVYAHPVAVCGLAGNAAVAALAAVKGRPHLDELDIYINKVGR